MQKNKKGNIAKAPVKTAKQDKNPAPNLSLDNILQDKSLYIFLGVTALLVLIVFRHFLSFDNLYLYKDIGSDTITYWWPHWVQLSEYIRTAGVPKWSFNTGAGQNIYAFGIGDPFSLFLCLLSKDSIPYAIIFMEVIKIISGGLFIYLYLRMLNLSLFTCIVGGVLYSFSGYMILGSGWYLVSTEALYASFVLYAGERFLRYGTWWIMPIPFCLLAVLQPFYLYLYGVLLAIYCTLRFILTGKQWKDILFALLKMGSLALFGVMLGSVVFFSNVLQLIQNPRVTGDASLFNTLSSSPLFQPSSTAQNTTALYRLFSSDLIGTGSNFKGVGNYLEAPVWYIGLICLLLAPQAFLFFNKRKRNIYLIFIVICLVPMVFVYFRYMFWLFSGDFYRTYTLFFALLILFFAVRALTYIERTSTVHIKTLLGTLLVLLFLLFYNFYGDGPNPVNTSLRNVIAFFLVLYTGFIYLMGNKQYRIYGIIGLSFCLYVELGYFSNITVNNRVVMKTSELHDKQGYDDYSVDAISYVKSIDPQFYRISKNYFNNASMFLTINDPQIQNFYGLTVYAEWNQFNYVRFLREMRTSTPDPTYSKWLVGPSDRLLLKTMLNVKYLFSRQPGFDFPSYGFTPINKTGDVTIGRNNYYLPLGYSYSKFITLSQFRQIGNNVQKDEMFLNACVVEDEDLQSFNGMQQLGAKDSVPAITFPAYKQYTDALKKDSLKISHFDQNNIVGTINVSDKKLLFFSIPYDKGWHATVDGKEVKKYKTNIGFTGLLLDKGEHQVEMHFILPLFTIGLWTSIVALLLYIFGLIKYRKARL